jgi:hypothetical protein
MRAVRFGNSEREGAVADANAHEISLAQGANIQLAWVSGERERTPARGRHSARRLRPARRAKASASRRENARCNVVGIALRFPFLLAVALVAAAAGDALVETISNTGIFGRGFDDNNHLSVIPALVAGLLLWFTITAARSFSLFRRGSTLGRGDWLIESATNLARESPLRDMPLVLGLQLLSLFAMESIEQLAFGGRLLGGTVWLGGPIAFSLITHAILGAGCTLLLAALVRAILATVASLVRDAIDAILFSLSRDGGRTFVKRDADEVLPRAQAPHLRQFGGRAPPALPLAA